MKGPVDVAPFEHPISSMASMRTGCYRHVREVVLIHSSVSRSFLSAATWFFLRPFVAIALLALLVLGFGGLAVAMQLIAVLLKHAGV